MFDKAANSQSSYSAAMAPADVDAGFTVIRVMENIPTYVASEIPPEVLAATRNDIKVSLAEMA